MFGKVRIVTKSKTYTADIARINEPFLDGGYVKSTEVPTLMWDSFYIISEINPDEIESFHIIEFRDIECEGIDDGYEVDDAEIKLLYKIPLGDDSGKWVLKCQ